MGQGGAALSAFSSTRSSDMAMGRTVERLQFDNVCDVIKQAFRPLHCIVEVHPYRDQISFRVYDVYGHLLYKSEKLPAHRLCYRGYLHRTLTDARLNVATLGFMLEPLALARKARRGPTHGTPVLSEPDVQESAAR